MVVTIILAVAAVAVLAAIVVVATGGGGELSVEHPDHPPLALPARRSVGGTDAALLRLPMGLWGYHKQITDAALERFAHELTERETRIAVLEQELAEARQRAGGDDRSKAGSWRPAVPAATPPPDALGTPDTLTDMPAGGRAGERGPSPDRDEPRTLPPPPTTMQDRVVFDPRQAGRRDEAGSWPDPGERAEDEAARPERREPDAAAPWAGSGERPDERWPEPGGRTQAEPEDGW
jgi:hypothetical protein